jgi:hypothetical protein
MPYLIWSCIKSNKDLILLELSDRYPELSPLIKGASFAQLFDLLYKLAQLRYADLPILSGFNKKIATKFKLPKLVKAGYLQEVDGWFFTGHKALETLKNEGYNTAILRSNLTGGAGQHQRVLSAVISGVMKEPHFYRVFYPIFHRDGREWLIPDACVVYREGNRYKLTMLEVEVSAKQDGYLEDKMRRYNQLAKDRKTYDSWWKVQAGKLELPMCSIQNFCFGVRVER